MAKSSHPQGDGYSDMPLNTRQQSAVSIIKQWHPIQAQHIKCVQTAITVIANVLYKPTEPKYHQLSLNKPKVKKIFVDVVGGLKLLKLAGFQQTIEDSAKVLAIEAPTTVEEFEQLTDIWLVLLKTQYLWGINPDSNAPKKALFPKQFMIPNTLQHAMQRFFSTNDIAKSDEFQAYVQQSNDAQLSPTALQRYTYFAKAIQLISASDDTFFKLNANHGLNDIDASDVAALIVSEILCGYYDEDAAFTNLILAEDLRILAEEEQGIKAQYVIESTLDNAQNDEDDDKKEEAKVVSKYKKNERVVLEMKDEELQGTIRWIGESEKWEKGLWFGVQLDSEDLVYGHNGYYNQERFFGCAEYFGLYVRETQIVRVIDVAYKVVDIGCGWGNLGRLLMDKELRPYLNEIEKESELKKVDLYGFDVAKEMIAIAKDEKNGFDKYYKDMIVHDCKQNELTQFDDCSVDIITSTNCVMQDKKIGHPNETFLIEVNRMLKVNGWFLVTRRFHGVHLGLQLYAYLMIAQQLGWKNVFASRIREIFFIGWKKMPNPLK